MCEGVTSQHKCAVYTGQCTVPFQGLVAIGFLNCAEQPDGRIGLLASARGPYIPSPWCPTACHALNFERQSMVSKRQGF